MEITEDLTQLLSADSPVKYAEAAEAWFGYPVMVRQLVDKFGFKAVADIGGGANPVLDRDFIEDRKLDFTLVDIDGAELEKAPANYKKVVGDVTSPACGEPDSYDFAYSIMLAEHVKSGEALHRNLHRILKPGGMVFHYFPTLYCPPFVLNYFTPERLGSKMLFYFNPRDRFQNAKFPAHYSWCRGPVPAQLKRFRDLGFEVLLYRGFFGHVYYRRIPLLRNISAAFARHLIRNPNPWLTSFSWMVLRKKG